MQKVRNFVLCVVSVMLLGIIFAPISAAAAVSNAPMSTTLIVMFLTVFSFESKTTTALAYIGVALFGASFLIEGHGMALPLIVWGMGASMWMAGVYYGIKGSHPTFRLPTRHMMLA